MKAKCKHLKKDTYWVKHKGFYAKCPDCGQWFKCIWNRCAKPRITK